MSVTEFHTKILAAFVKEKKIFTLKLPCEECLNYELKTVQNKFVCIVTNITTLVWQTARRITNEILGVKGLSYYGKLL